LAAVGDTLVVGISGKLVGLNPLTGSMRWETSIASPRGTNDVERLVDLVSPAARVDDVVCARAFQAAIGCVNANRGNLVWTKYSSGSLGITGNDERLFSVESDGALQAWSRLDGEKLWSVTWLRGRQSVAPVHANGLVLVGDASGNLHMFSPTEGKLLGRVSTDPSGLVAAPIQVGNTLIAVAASGKVFGWALPN
jgi:outer membrane protein assembly factor BamB